MPGSTSWVMRARPKTLVSNIVRTFCRSVSSTVPYSPYPALLTRVPTLPWAASTSATAAAIDSSDVTSSLSVRAPAAARSVSDSGRRAVA